MGERLVVLDQLLLVIHSSAPESHHVSLELELLLEAQTLHLILFGAEPSQELSKASLLKVLELPETREELLKEKVSLESFDSDSSEVALIETEQTLA